MGKINAFLNPYPAAPHLWPWAPGPAVPLQQGDFALPPAFQPQPPAVTTSFGAPLIGPRTSAHTDAPLMRGILFPWPKKFQAIYRTQFQDFLGML